MPLNQLSLLFIFFRETSPMHSPSSIISTSSCSSVPPALPPKQKTRKPSVKSPPPTPPPSADYHVSSPIMKALPDLLEHTAKTDEKYESSESSVTCEEDLMEKPDIDVKDHLVFKKADEDGPDIRGGPIDALIIQATKATKNGGNHISYFLNFI